MRKEIIVVGIVILLFGGVLAVFGAIPYEVEYTGTEQYTEEVTETMTETLISVSDKDLEARHYQYSTRTIDGDSDIYGDFDSNIDLDVYVFTNDQFNDFRDGKSTSAVISRKQTSSAAFSLHVGSDKTYVFVVYNYHYFDDAVYDFEVTREWEETREETREREVTRYRTEYSYTLNFIGMFLIPVGIVVAIVGAVVKPPKEKEIISPVATVTPIAQEPIEEPKPTVIDCSGCGYPIHVSNEYCPFCGTKIEV